MAEGLASRANTLTITCDQLTEGPQFAALKQELASTPALNTVVITETLKTDEAAAKLHELLVHPAAQRVYTLGFENARVLDVEEGMIARLYPIIRDARTGLRNLYFGLSCRPVRASLMIG